MIISGVSGVATKTSFALFFLRCLTSHPEILGPSARNLRVLVFNVKGEDLMFLDKPNNQFTDDDGAKWTRLGMEPNPFPSVSFWGPAMERAGKRGDPRHRRAIRRDRSVPVDAPGVHRRWTAAVRVHRDRRMSRQQLTFVAERVLIASYSVRGMRRRRTARMRRVDATRLLSTPTGPSSASPDDQVIETFGDLVEAIAPYLEPDDDFEPDDVDRAAWRVERSRVHATALRRDPTHRSAGACRRKSSRIDRMKEAVTVVDIHGLHDAAQRFVVGALVGRGSSRERGQGTLPALRDRSRRAQQVRAPRGVVSDQRHARGHRATGAFLGHPSDRCTTERRPASTPTCFRTPASGFRDGSMRPKPSGRSTAGCCPRPEPGRGC